MKLPCEKCVGRGTFCNGSKKMTNFPFKGPLPLVAGKTVREYLIQKARSLRQRDKQKVMENVMPERCYFAALAHTYTTMENSNDPYTGREICWGQAGQGGKHKKAPAVDHKNPNINAPMTDEGESNFVFCTSEMNDAKNDLSIKDFSELCCDFLRHLGFDVKPPK